MVELVYTVDLKSTAERIVGSSPTGGTKNKALTSLYLQGSKGLS